MWCYLGWDTEQNSFGKVVPYHGESPWVLPCSQISRFVFSDTVTLQMFCGEVYQLKGYVKEPSLKVIWCNRMVLTEVKRSDFEFRLCTWCHRRLRARFLNCQYSDIVLEILCSEALTMQEQLKSSVIRNQY